MRRFFCPKAGKAERVKLGMEIHQQNGRSGCQWLRCLAFVLLLSVGCERADDVASVDVAAVAATPTALPAAKPMEEPPEPSPDEELMAPFVPDWVADAVFYQIFPERFRNGDSSNDPVRESLEDPPSVPKTWKLSSWTGDWYERADWEKELSDSFYEHGVFQRRYGGDLQGVIDKLDYLEHLGINAIYFNPVFYARSMHKYDAASMHHIDPYFGPDPAGDLEIIASESSDPKTWQWTAADKLFLDLVRQLHERGMRVIIDGVFNHTGRDFFAFADLRAKQKESEYQDWYIVQHFDDPATPQNDFRYKSWWGFESLPEFADNESQQDLQAGPKQYVFDITRRWMDPNADGDPSDGIDGWRLDVANEVPMGFWLDWNTLVRELNPQAYTVGEFWGNAREHLIGGRFSATMNYHGFAYLVKGFLIDGKLTAHDFGLYLRERLDEYPPSMRFAMQNLVDSHDTDRVASMIVNSPRKTYVHPERFDYDVSEVVSPRHSPEYSVSAPTKSDRRIQRLVALMQMTFVGPPMIYYGTEAGMWGADDPCNRQPMVWADMEYQQQVSDPLGRARSKDSVHFDSKLFSFYAGATRLRAENNILRRGKFEVLMADDPAQFFAFRRSIGDDSMLVAINRGDTPYRWTTTCRNGHSYAEVFSASGHFKEIKIEQDGTQVAVTIPALDGAVLAEQPWEE